MGACVKHLIISGQVQGVGFRYYLLETTRRLGVRGWVRNRRDGTVEAMVEGAPEAVAKIIEWAKSGPDGARVTGVNVTEGEGRYTRFEQLPTL
ncbi:MAG: acylphosphatase [Burkholderiales bacterium]